MITEIDDLVNPRSDFLDGVDLLPVNARRLRNSAKILRHSQQFPSPGTDGVVPHA